MLLDVPALYTNLSAFLAPLVADGFVATSDMQASLAAYTGSGDMDRSTAVAFFAALAASLGAFGAADRAAEAEAAKEQFV